MLATISSYEARQYYAHFRYSARRAICYRPNRRVAYSCTRVLATRNKLIPSYFQLPTWALMFLCCAPRRWSAHERSGEAEQANLKLRSYQRYRGRKYRSQNFCTLCPNVQPMEHTSEKMRSTARPDQPSRAPTPSSARFTSSSTEANDARGNEPPVPEHERQAFLPLQRSEHSRVSSRDGRTEHIPIVRKPVAASARPQEPSADTEKGRSLKPYISTAETFSTEASPAQESSQSEGKHRFHVVPDPSPVANTILSSDRVKSIWRIWALELASLVLSLIFFASECYAVLNLECWVYSYPCPSSHRGRSGEVQWPGPPDLATQNHPQLVLVTIHDPHEGCDAGARLRRDQSPPMGLV